jgi:hypothetical protein
VHGNFGSAPVAPADFENAIEGDFLRGPQQEQIMNEGGCLTVLGGAFSGSTGSSQGVEEQGAQADDRPASG